MAEEAAAARKLSFVLYYFNGEGNGLRRILVSGEKSARNIGIYIFLAGLSEGISVNRT